MNNKAARAAGAAQAARILARDPVRRVFAHAAETASNPTHCTSVRPALWLKAAQATYGLPPGRTTLVQFSLTH